MSYTAQKLIDKNSQQIHPWRGLRELRENMQYKTITPELFHQTPLI